MARGCRMDLTVSERQALRTLVKRQRQWQWFRYVSLVLGVAILGAALWQGLELRRELLETTRKMSFTESPTGMEVYFASQYGGLIAVVDLLPMLGGFVIGMTVARWRGNPVDRLLIGVVSRVVDQPVDEEQEP
jgi:hypothetical protein